MDGTGREDVGGARRAYAGGEGSEPHRAQRRRDDQAPLSTGAWLGLWGSLTRSATDSVGDRQKILPHTPGLAPKENLPHADSVDRIQTLPVQAEHVGLQCRVMHVLKRRVTGAAMAVFHAVGVDVNTRLGVNW